MVRLPRNGVWVLRHEQYCLSYSFTTFLYYLLEIVLGDRGFSVRRNRLSSMLVRI